MIPLLAAIARQSGLPDWTALSARAEVLDFAGLALPVAEWLVYLITRVQDFAFSIAGVLMIAVLHGRTGLSELFGRLLRWRVGRRWWLLALLPLGLYLLATAVSGALSSFTFTGQTVRTILISAEAGLLVTLLLRGPMGEELGAARLCPAATANPHVTLSCQRSHWRGVGCLAPACTDRP